MGLVADLLIGHENELKIGQIAEVEIRHGTSFKAWHGLDPRTEKIFERTEEAVREIATLFVALAPLDVVLVNDFLIVMGAVVFVCVGGLAVVWIWALRSDSKRNR